MSVWSYWIHDARTGDPILQVHPRGGSATPRLTGTGESTYTFDLLDRKTCLDRAVVRDLFRANDRTISVRWGNHVAYAGLLLTPRFSNNTGTVAVRSREIRAIWDERLTFPMNNYPAGDLTVSGKNVPGLVRAILARGMQWGTEWVLPIDLPADGAGGEGGDWKNYQMLTINDLLGQVEAKGFEIHFRPYLTTGNGLRWETVIGRPINYGTTDLPVSVPGSDVSDLDVVEDGSRQLSGTMVAGNGTDLDMVTGWAGFGGDTGGPRMIIRDAYRSAKDERDVAKLTQIAQEYLNTSRAPVEQWSFSVDLASGRSPAETAPGCVLIMDTRNNPWIEDGAHNHRVIALNIDTSLRVQPEVQKL